MEIFGFFCFCRLKHSILWLGTSTAVYICSFRATIFKSLQNFPTRSTVTWYSRRTPLTIIIHIKWHQSNKVSIHFFFPYSIIFHYKQRNFPHCIRKKWGQKLETIDRLERDEHFSETFKWNYGWFDIFQSWFNLAALWIMCLLDVNFKTSDCFFSSEGQNA